MMYLTFHYIMPVVMNTMMHDGMMMPADTFWMNSDVVGHGGNNPEIDV